jgi:hypothetical protein
VSRDRSSGFPLPEEWADLTDAFDREWNGLYEQVAAEVFKEFPDHPPPCPWALEGLSPELFTRQIICYWAIDRLNPATGKTPLRDWVDKRVSDPRLRGTLLWAEHPKIRDLVVRAPIDQDRVWAEDLLGGGRFRLWVTPDRREYLVPGARIHGAVHPWGRDQRVNGVVQIQLAPAQATRSGLIELADVHGLVEEFLRREATRIDDRALRRASPLSTILAGYPAEWIDAICRTLDLPVQEKKRAKIRRIQGCLSERPTANLLAGIRPQGLQALRWLLERGGVVPRGSFMRRFPGDDGRFWEMQKETGPIGALRARGLVAFGRVGDPAGRMVRIALVPLELRARLVDAIEVQGGSAPGRRAPRALRAPERGGVRRGERRVRPFSS